MTLSPYGGPIVALVQIEGYRSAAGSLVYRIGHGTRARGTLAIEGTVTEATVTLRYSDAGYRSSPADAGGVRAYEPYLEENLAIDRKLGINPLSPWASVAWGQARVRLTPGLTEVINDYNSDGRDLKVYMVRKIWDAQRYMWLDPPFSDADLIFQGLSGPWRLGEYYLTVPLRDASYWLDRPVQQTLYAGTGTYEGPADLRGTPKPRARGGTSGDPIRNVRPVLIDPANLIYQYSDAAGTVVNLYEGGYAGTTFQANTTNLYSGTTNAGQYRTDNSRGMFQLGTSPVREVTADVTGAFPVAGAQSNLTTLLRYSLTEDMQLPSGLLDTTAFATLASSLAYVGGYWIGTEEMSGFQLASYLMESQACYLLPQRNGTIRPWAMRALTGTETPALTLTDGRIAAMTQRQLEAPLDPPPYRWRVGYQRNHLIQTNDLSSLITNARKLTISQKQQTGVWSSAPVLASYRRPSDPPEIGGGLLVQADAEAVASALGALYSGGAGLYEVVLPLSLALSVDIGSVLHITYPIERFRTGRLVQIVGESLRLGDGTASVEVFG